MTQNFDSGVAVFILVGIGLAMVLVSSPGGKLAMDNSDKVDVSNPVGAVKNTGGGGGGAPTVTEDARIVNAKACPYIIDGRRCTSTMQSTNDWVCIYWEYEGGIGCCKTMGCDYDAFTKLCFDGEVKLWEMRIDGEVFIPSPEGYTYYCQDTIPWNWHCFEDFELGKHEFTIIQKDCVKAIAVKTLEVTLTSSDNETFWITYDEV